jgi:hypothetical protein
MSSGRSRSGGAGAPALSPDGTRIVFVASRDGIDRVAGNEAHISPFGHPMGVYLDSLPTGSSGEQAVNRKRPTNTPVRQAGPVLKCPDDRKNRVVSVQATYPCGSSAVGGRVCEQRYAAERVLPESRVELQHTGSPSKETALVAHRQPTSGTEGGSDSVCRGKLPSVEDFSARLLFRDSPGAWRSPDPVPSRPYSRCVGRPAFIDSSPWY